MKRVSASLVVVALAAVFLFTGIVGANTVPPRPTAYFYGDANGDTGVTGTDLIQHYNYILSKAYTYDTLQPNNPAQAWNTCDVNSDRGCSGTDTITMNSYILSKSVSIVDDPWSVNNVDLPLTGNAANTLIPFTIDLHSTFTALPSGRPGITVVVEIDPVLSVGTGHLSGRECNPVAGTRDQSAAAGAQCALSVAQTNWPVSTAVGLTESGTYGLGVYSNGDGDLNLLVYTTATPGLDLPATSTRIIVAFGIVTPTAGIDCANPGPNPVNEYQLIQCTVTGAPGTPIVDSGTDTCGGTITAGIYSFTPGEGGTRTCVAGVINGTATDSDIVNIIDVNQNPIITSTCATTATEGVLYTCNLTATDADLPAQTLTWSLSGDTCGGAIVGSAYTWTPTEAQGGAGACVVGVQVADNFATPGTDTQSTTVTPAEVNQSPTIALTCPASVTEPAAINCTIAVGDGDLPVNTLSCSIGAGDTCGGTLTGCTNYDLASSAGKSPSCAVDIEVNDNAGQPNSTATDTAVVTVIPESVTLTCPASANEDASFSCTITSVGGSACAIGAGNTCTGATLTGCTQIDFTAQGEAAPANCTVAVTKGSASDSEIVAINEVNANPVITSTCATTATEGVLYTCNLTATDADLPAQTLTWSLSGDTCGGTITGSTYNWTPTEAQGGAGTCVVGVQVADNFATPGTATQNTTVTPAEVNVNPVITSTCAITATEGVLYTCNLTATDADLPAQTLTWTTTVSDTCGGTITGSAYNWTPTEAQGGAGTCVVGVQVADNFATPGTDTQNTTVTPAEANQSPTIALTCPASVTEPAAINCTIAVGDGDLPANTLSCSLGAGDTCGGTLTGCTGYSLADSTGKNPSCDVQVVVDDNTGQPNSTATDLDNVSVLVGDSVSLTCPASVNEDATSSCTITSTGTSPCSVGAATTCTGVTITLCTQIDIAAQGEAAGPGNCDVQVVKGTENDTNNILILEVNQNPVITSTCATTATEGVLYTCNLTATDADLPVQTLTWTTAVSDTCGGTIVGSAYNWTPTEAQGGAGTCVVGVQVADNFATPGTATQNTTVTPAEVNTAPDFSNLPTTQNCTQGSTCSFAATKVDSDIPQQTLTCQIATGTGATQNTTISPTAAGAGNTSTDTLDDVFLNDDTGLPLNVAPTNNNQFQITDGGIRMEVTTFDLTTIPVGATITAVELRVERGTDAASNGAMNNYVQYNNGAGFVNTTIQGVDTNGTWAAGTYNLFAQGVDSRAEIGSVIIGYTNNDPANGDDYFDFDYVQLYVEYNVSAPLDTCGWGTLTDTPGVSGSSCTYSGTAGAAGCTVTLRVSDGVAAPVDEVLTINITINLPPVWTSTAATTATEGIVYTYNMTATDPEANPITFQRNTGTDTCGGTVVGSTYTWTPTEAQGGAGACVVGVQACDLTGSGGCTDQNTNVTPAEVNVNPVITSTCATTATELVAYTCNLTATDADLPAQTLTWTTTAADTCGGTITGSTYNWTPTEAQGGAGTCVVGVQVADNFGTPGTATQNTTVTPAEVNQAPTVGGATTATSTGGAVTPAINVTGADADLPTSLAGAQVRVERNGGTCTGTVTGLPTAYGAGTIASTFTYLPAAGDPAGSCTVLTRACDQAATPLCSANNTVTITLTNTTPTLVVTNITVAEGATSGNITATATDPDNCANGFGTVTTSRNGGTCAGTVNGLGIIAQCANGGVADTFTYTALTEEPGTTCTIIVHVVDGRGAAPADQTVTVTITEVNVNPVITSTCPTTGTVGTLYTCTLTATDSDLPAQTLTWSLSAANTCGGTVTVATNPGTYSWTPAAATTCVVGVQVADNFAPAGTATQSTTVVVTGGVTITITGVSVSGTLGGIDPTIARIKNNYPADWNQFTLNFSGSPGAACSATVNCGSAVTVTGAPSGNNCVVTATAGYWPSTATCTISAPTSTTSCTNCAAYTTTFATSLRTSECATRGGTCGGFIDNGTYGTGDGLNIYLIDMKSITGGYVIPPASTYVYVLTEHPAQVPPTRIEAFDANRDGLVTITSANGLRTEAAKISAGYKNVTGTCAYEPAFGINENLLCYRYVTMADIDARRVNLPMELTTVGDWDQPEAQLWGYIPIAGFISYVGTTPAGNTFPNPVRAGFAILGLIDQGMSSINLDELLRPTGQNSTLSLCFQELGLNVGGIALPGNLMLPDLVRQDWNAACSNNWKMSPANTTFRIYTNRGNMTRKVIAMGASVVSTLFDLYKSLDITQLPITMTALGTDTIVIPALTVDINMGSNGGVWASGYTTPKSVPFEFDYRVASSYPVRLHVANPPYDPARVALGVAATPDYGDPNRNGTANHSGQMYIFGENLLLTGVRAGASGLIPFQLVMTPMIDDNVFTVFQRHNTAAKTFGDQEPWGVGGTSRVVSATMRGLPSTTTDADITWSSATLGLVGIMMRGFAESVAASGAASGQIDVPGSSSNSNMVGVLESYNNQIIGAASWLPLPTLTSPANNGYFVPPQADVRTWPINRNGQLIRGTATIAGHPIQIAAGARYFTLSNPSVNAAGTRYPDLYYMDLKDTRHIATNYNDPVRDYPVNTLWRMYGNINAQASLTVTLPFIAPRRVTLSGVYGMVPDPWEAGNFVNLSMDWALTELIIDSGVRGMNRKWSYQNFSIVYLYENSYLSAGESHQFIWK